MKEQLETLVLQMYRSGILYSEAVREFKKRFILSVLRETQGNQCKAARQMGMHRNTLSRTLAELGVDAREIREASSKPWLRSRKKQPQGVRPEQPKQMQA